MGLFETLLILIILAINFIPQLSSRLSKMPEYPFCGLLILFIVHLMTESFRWQLTLFYGVIILYLSLFAFLIHKKVMKKSFKVNLEPVTKLVVVIIVATVLLNISVPVIKIPDVTGLKRVGTVTYPIVNPKRNDIYSESGKEARNFNIQIFYPTDQRSAIRASWLEDNSVTMGLSKYLNVPDIFMSHLHGVDANSYCHVPVSKDKKWPVVIVSHGWNGFRNVHQDLVEDLASWGYVVVTVDHTYGTLGTVLADGTIQLYNEEALPTREETSEYLFYGNQLINTYADDIFDTIEALEIINERAFEGLMNLESIALVGHSTGGGAALKVSMINDDVDALICYDPWVEPMDPSFLSRKLSIPTLIFTSTDWVHEENAQNLEKVLSRAEDEMRHYEAVGFEHLDFTLISRLSPWTKIAGMSGAVSFNRVTDMLRTYNLTFLNSIFWEGSKLSDTFDAEYEEMRLLSSVYNIGN